MNIDEAMKLQNELLPLLTEVGFNKYIVSTQLGIEALTYISKQRRVPPILYIPLLPGETWE